MSVSTPLTSDLLFLDEPLLEFGHGQTSTSPQEGLFLYGPLADPKNPKEIRIGVVGTPHGIQLFKNWSEQIKGVIKPQKGNEEKRENAPKYIVPFPGFEAAFKVAWPDTLIAEVPISFEEVQKALLTKGKDQRTAVFDTVSLFQEAIITHLSDEDTTPNLWFVVIPDFVYEHGRPKSAPPPTKQIKNGENRLFTTRQAGQFKSIGGLLPLPEFQEAAIESEKIGQYEANFHHQLKARLLKEKAVIQIIRESTIAPRKPKKLLSPHDRQLEDAAAVAWNLCTTAFFKSEGKPWKLATVRPRVCYVGLVYKKVSANPSDTNACCAAQMFLNSGDGLVFKGAVGPWRSLTTGEYHLTKDKAAELMNKVISAYKASNNDEFPKELFIHGQTRFNDEEWEGFASAVPEGTNLVGVRIIDTGDEPSNVCKLFRPGAYPVLRNTAYLFSPNAAYLWTRGFIPRLDTYPGFEAPNPLLIEINKGASDLQTVLRDVLALTKVNFNACKYGDGKPVTLRFADAVGEILTATPEDCGARLPFKFYI